MNTATLQPVIHIYNHINIGKFSTTRHYELVETQNGKSKLTTLLNISENRDFANSKPKFWVKERVNNTWRKPCLTGLFNTYQKNIFKGDKDKRKHLLIFKFSEVENTLTVYYFEHYFTTDLKNVLGFIKD